MMTKNSLAAFNLKYFQYAHLKKDDEELKMNNLFQLWVHSINVLKLEEIRATVPKVFFS